MSDDNDELKDLTHTTSGYRRALLVVVVLNLGMGIAEMIGGVLAGSQALKADALDFLGDGTITLLGLLAIRWGSRWRAKSAMGQGVFLAALGVGVIANAAYRAFVRRVPEADMMGVVGAIALAINVISALVLVPHRKGDSNVRAVWLFSRNDAIGNVAVIAAAGLVYWTRSVWPDLIVAIVIAGLFLHSAVQILRAAREDLGSGGQAVDLPGSTAQVPASRGEA